MKALTSQLRRRLFHLWFLFRRPMTLGARVIVQDGEGQVLLVRHTYVEGWYLPGGGVEKGHTLEMTARREVEEETGIRLTGRLELVGMFLNSSASLRDHVALYVCQEFEVARLFEPNREIAESGFFSPNELPVNTTPATRRRLKEHYSGSSHPVIW